MAGITLVRAQTNLDAWLLASEAAARNQSYRIGDRELTRANAREIRESIIFWEGMVQKLTPGASRTRVRRATPVSI